MKKLIGLKMLFIKKHKTEEGLEFRILFDDNKTILFIENQDYYSYHNFDSSAKTMRVTQNKELYSDCLLLEDATDNDLNFID